MNTLLKSIRDEAEKFCASFSPDVRSTPAAIESAMLIAATMAVREYTAGLVSIRAQLADRPKYET
jgi:hypothetical protein